MKYTNSLLDEEGTIHQLDQYENLLLYFYPKDDTPGCTMEACGLRDSFDELIQHNIAVLGIGKGSKRDHIKFREKYHLPFHLLLDPDLLMTKAFGVVIKKSMFGKLYNSIKRTTFLLHNGEIVHTWENVNPVHHANEILSFLKT